MKILHWAIVLIAIILPISLICRNVVNSRFAALKDEVRINNAIDVATHDAIDQIIAVSGFDFSDEFGGVIDITPALAQESIDTFFHTMAVNYNLPYKISDATVSVGDSTQSDIKNYFASYIPAVLVIAYDGFYVYSQTLVKETLTGKEYYKYQLSSKIPYTYDAGNYSIGYTLGDDIYIYANNKCYSGRMMYNDLGTIETKYTEMINDYSSYISNTNDIAYISSSDISMVLYSLKTRDNIDIGKELLPESDVTNFLQDYTKDTNGNYTVGAFHENRRKTIIKIITECLSQEINVEHNRFASLVGSTYDFYLPEITDDDWINTIDDITVMAFVQGIPVGTTEGVYYNNFALGGSQIVKRDYLYGNIMVSPYSGRSIYLYHKSNCPIFTETIPGYANTPYDKNTCWILNDENQLINERGEKFSPCQLCN